MTIGAKYSIGYSDEKVVELFHYDGLDVTFTLYLRCVILRLNCIPRDAYIITAHVRHTVVGNAKQTSGLSVT